MSQEHKTAKQGTGYRQDRHISISEMKKQTVIHWCLWMFHVVVDFVVDLIFRYFVIDYNNKKQILPIKYAFLTESASTLAEKIRSKKITSEELVNSCIERIKDVNKYLNCIVDERYDEALEEAKRADKLISSAMVSVDELKQHKPFLGVPFTSKESTHAAGMNNTYGIVARKGSKAREDAVIITRVKEGGGILLAITNVPELNLWQETRNNLYGQTNNPYNLSRTVGGSSGGEAAAVAACASPFGIGTDIGGSIRMPCYFCGIFGHKPTTGLIDTKGMTYRTGEEERTMVTAGPMARHTEDLIPLLRLLLGQNVSKLKLDTEVVLTSVRVCYVTDPGDRRVSGISEEVRGCIVRAVDYLEEKCGTPAKQLNLPGLNFSYTLWRYWMTKEPGNFAFDLGNRKREVSLMTEIPKMLIGKSEYTLPAILKILEEAVFPPVPTEWAEDLTDSLRQALLEELGDNGVLLFPSFPFTAKPHYMPFFRPFNFAYWAIVNVLCFPATQVPLGLASDGLPLGIQIVSAPYNDHLCIAVAKELERAFGGYIPPCPVTTAH